MLVHYLFSFGIKWSLLRVLTREELIRIAYVYNYEQFALPEQERRISVSNVLPDLILTLKEWEKVTVVNQTEDGDDDKDGDYCLTEEEEEEEMTTQNLGALGEFDLLLKDASKYAARYNKRRERREERAEQTTVLVLLYRHHLLTILCFFP